MNFPARTAASFPNSKLSLRAWNSQKERKFSLFLVRESSKRTQREARFFSCRRRGLPAIIEISSCSRTAAAFYLRKYLFLSAAPRWRPRVRCQLEDSLFSFFLFFFSLRAGSLGRPATWHRSLPVVENSAAGRRDKDRWREEGGKKLTERYSLSLSLSRRATESFPIMVEAEHEATALPPLPLVSRFRVDVSEIRNRSRNKLTR